MRANKKYKFDNEDEGNKTKYSVLKQVKDLSTVSYVPDLNNNKTINIENANVDYIFEAWSSLVFAIFSSRFS